MSTFSVNVLGCGSARPSLRHNPSCTVLNIRESLYMVDCGEGAQLGMQRKGLKFHRLNHIFLTHLHGDHIFGLPGLIGSMALMGRTGHITIHTFKEGAEILKTIFDHFCSELPYEVIFNIIEPKRAVVYEDEHMTVRTIPLNHRVPCVGYVFEEKPKPLHLDRAAADFHGLPRSQYASVKAGQPFVKPDGTVIPAEYLTRPANPSFSYAHIGDTAYMPGIAKEIGPVNLLFHESTYLKINEADAKARGHSTAEQAAMVARDAGVGQLLLGHYSSRYKDDHLFEQEARPIFANSLAAYEGLTINMD